LCDLHEAKLDNVLIIFAVIIIIIINSNLKDPLLRP